MLPYGTAVFGMVMLLKPVVPLAPVTLNCTLVVAADWLGVIVKAEISELVTSPLKPMFTVWLVVVTVALTVGVGVGVGVGEG